MDQQPQPYVQPQFVMMPTQRPTNGLAVFGFLVALIGLFIPTGIVALLGLVLCLAAIGRPPRGLATMGVIIGLFGTVIWLVIMLGLLAVGVVATIAAALGMTAAFMLTQPEVVELTTDMVNVAIEAEDYQKRKAGRKGKHS